MSCLDAADVTDSAERSGGFAACLVRIGKRWCRRRRTVPVWSTSIYDPEFEEGERPDGFRSRRARVGYQLGTELIGASVWELPPGQAAYPYHFHYADEELIVVLAGRPTLRTTEGSHQLQEGEAVAFGLGEQGAHQLINHTEQTVRFLAISSHGRPDIVVYQTRARSEQESGCRAAADCERSSASKTPSTTGPTSRHPDKTVRRVQSADRGILLGSACGGYG